MGFRFRRSIRLAPGIRLNLTSRGLSATVGPRGTSINVGPRGTYANVGIPGTGLSSRARLDPHHEPSHDNQLAPPVEPPLTEAPDSTRSTRPSPYAAPRRPVWPWILLGAVIGCAMTFLFRA
jgi:hypothetical protein